MPHREFSKDAQISHYMTKGNPGPEETTHKPSDTVSITDMLSSTHCALSWVMQKKRYCERRSLPLSNCSLGLCYGWYQIPAADTTAHGLWHFSVPLPELPTPISSWHTYHGHASVIEWSGTLLWPLRLPYLNDLCFTKVNKGQHVLKLPLFWSPEELPRTRNQELRYWQRHQHSSPKSCIYTTQMADTTG